MEPAKLLEQYFVYHEDASISQDMKKLSKKKYNNITHAAKDIGQK